MPRETLKDRVFKEASRWLNDSPSIAPELPYAFENGTPYIELTKAEGAFIPDRGFDGPA